MVRSESNSEPTTARERRRVRVRQQIAADALELILERGYDNVTVDELAESAAISPRTFFRYFQSREDVLFVDEDQSIAAFREALESRPHDEAPLTSLYRALSSLAQYTRTHLSGIRDRQLVIDHTPSLRRRQMDSEARWERITQEVLAQRMGFDVDTNVECAMLAAHTVATMRIARTVWRKTGASDELPAIVDRAFWSLPGMAAPRRSAARSGSGA